MNEWLPHVLLHMCKFIFLWMENAKHYGTPLLKLGDVIITSCVWFFLKNEDTVTGVLHFCPHSLINYGILRYAVYVCDS